MIRIWCEGYQAFWTGKWMRENPYVRPGGYYGYEADCAHAWFHGWLAANRDPYERFK